MLIIDTDDKFINRLKEFLYSKNISNVATALTVKEGLKIAGNNKPDIVLVDMTTSDVDGFDAIQAISRIDNSIKILITTDCYTDEYCDMAFESGADAFIDKNNFKEDILTIINTAPKNLLFLFEKYIISKN